MCLCTYIYDAWGELYDRFISDNVTQYGYASVYAAADKTDLSYSYREYEATGTLLDYYLKSRYYAPWLCRFVSADLPQIAQMSKDEHAGLNLYAYCGNNPVMYSDPTGFYAQYSAASIIYCFIEDYLLKGRVVTYNNTLKYEPYLNRRSVSFSTGLFSKTIKVYWGNKQSWSKYLVEKKKEIDIKRGGALSTGSEEMGTQHVIIALFIFIITMGMIYFLDTERTKFDSQNAYYKAIWSTSGFDSRNYNDYYLFYVDGANSYSGGYALKSNGTGFRRL